MGDRRGGDYLPTILSGEEKTFAPDKTKGADRWCRFDRDTLKCRTGSKTVVSGDEGEKRTRWRGNKGFGVT